jgi:hypothetical protein
MATIWNSSATANIRPQSIAGVTADIYRYVNEIGDDGWVQVLEGSSTLLPLCKYTKVMLLANKDGRTSFKVLDGTHAGKTASMKIENAKKYLGVNAPKESIIEINITYENYEEGWISVARRNQKLDQQWGELIAGGLKARVTMNTVWGTGFYPLPAGEYAILIPDVPHQGNMTTFYRSTEPSLKYDQVWFPIKFGDNSRYVHVGNVSDGCATVVDLAQWADLHEKLISHRSKDRKSVGKLIVKGKPERAK